MSGLKALTRSRLTTVSAMMDGESSSFVVRSAGFWIEETRPG
ncbi:MAG TPA: hypothetical protein VGM89_20385 [Puia sp.]